MPDALNDSCHCISLDEAALVRHFDAALLREGGLPRLLVGREHLFAPYPVFANQAQWDAMQAVIRAAHEVMALPAFRADALAGTEWPDQHTLSAMMAFDFHPEAGGAKLIEINTNAGGAYLAALLAESQRNCCEFVDGVLASPFCGREAPQRWFADFLHEWALARGERPLRRVLIVDDQPEQQFLYPEFLLFRELFRRNGVACDIADAAALRYDGNTLIHDGQHVDLVYNRCTDFALQDAAHAALRTAYLHDAVVLTPSPRHHLLHADKRRLVQLSDAGYLARIGASAADRRVLAAYVPKARLVTAADAEEIWGARKRYFFKPFAGYASRGAYRGERITRRVWAEIVASGQYIAQEYAPPATRRGGPGEDSTPLKFDLRCVSYGSELRLLSARLYQGQTTNLRTVSGGLASVFLLKSAADAAAPAQSSVASVASPNHTTA
jgi:hypothetical protein